jgi:predicted regulator of Ras-like GTPase activity (Roadblock/LC7/MglB family)
MAPQTQNNIAAAVSAETVNANLEELQETVSRLSSHKGVEAVIILNRDGDILAESSSSSLIALASAAAGSSSSQQQQQQDQEGSSSSLGGVDADTSSSGGVATATATATGASTATTARSVNQLLRTATAYIRSLSPDDEVSFVQIRTQQHREIYISPHHGYVLAVVKR